MVVMKVWVLTTTTVLAGIPVLKNGCYDGSMECPVSKEANARYTSLGMAGGKDPDEVDPVCRNAERSVVMGGSNASACLEALRLRMVLDEEEAKRVQCPNGTLALMHTWWDGPLVRVVALFLRSFRGTQNHCSKLVVWTPREGSERSTPQSRKLVAKIEGMSGPEVVFEPLDVVAMAKGTLFEDFVARTIVPESWETVHPGDKKEGTRHFSDFFQLFVLWRYGGIYFDADMILLRDFYPLWGLNFEYQWSFIPDKLNNAVQGLRKGRDAEKLIVHGGKLESSQCCKGWGATLWRAKFVKTANTYALPCTAFDPFWLRLDGHHTGEAKNPSLPYPTPFDRTWLFRSPYDPTTKPWYHGAFAIHWHGGAGGPKGGDTNVWDPEIRPGSYADYWEHIWS